MVIQDLILNMRNYLGDNNFDDPNITDSEYELIIKNSAAVYSRMKGLVKTITVNYDDTTPYYDIPTDSYRVISVVLKSHDTNFDFSRNINMPLRFEDNFTQIILNDLPDAENMTLTLDITYSYYLKAEDIDEREIDLVYLYAECLCYKLMASKTADLIKFSSGEKIIDESLISDKYLKLFKETEKNFRKKMIKSYGKRANNMLENLDYNLRYPPIGEEPGGAWH